MAAKGQPRRREGVGGIEPGTLDEKPRYQDWGRRGATYPGEKKGVALVYIDPAWKNVIGYKHGATFSEDERANAMNVIRAGIRMWNQQGEGRYIFKETNSRDAASIIVEDPAAWDANVMAWHADDPSAAYIAGMGEYPHPGKEHLWLRDDLDPEFYEDAEKWIGFNASNVAHELGHTQGLKHKNMSRTAGVMRYGIYENEDLMPGGREKTKPTEAEVRKVLRKQGRTIPVELRKDQPNPTDRYWGEFRKSGRVQSTTIGVPKGTPKMPGNMVRADVGLTVYGKQGRDKVKTVPQAERHARRWNSPFTDREYLQSLGLESWYRSPRHAEYGMDRY